MYKEGSDRTLLGLIQATAVYWSGVMTKLWYCSVFKNDTAIVGCSERVVPSMKYSLDRLCVQLGVKFTGENYR